MHFCSGKAALVGKEQSRKWTDKWARFNQLIKKCPVTEKPRVWPLLLLNYIKLKNLCQYLLNFLSKKEKGIVSKSFHEASIALP